MMNQAAHLYVETPQRRDRIHVLIRLVLLVTLAAIGCSSLYWLLFLAIPALAALAITQKGAHEYTSGVAPRLLPALRWLAGAYAYLWLLTDAAPTTEPLGQVDLEVQPGGAPTPASALMRLLTSLPAMIVLAVLSFVSSILWVVGALAILINARLPVFVAEFIAGTLRYQFRLIAYHLSIVDVYPAFDTVETPHLFGSGAA